MGTAVNKVNLLGREVWDSHLAEMREKYFPSHFRYFHFDVRDDSNLNDILVSTFLF